MLYNCMEIILNEDGTISFKEEEKEIKSPIDLYSSEVVSTDVIDLCNNLSLSNNQTLFIFDRRINNYFNILTEVDNIDIFYVDEKYFISNKNGFYPNSRMPLYDTNIKIANIYDRYNYAYSWIKNHLGFKASEWNLGREYEQNFTRANYSICLRPNLTLVVKKFTNVEYDGYFSISELYKFIPKDEARDLKIKSLLNLQ